MTKKETTQYIITGVMILFLIIVVWKNLSKGAQKAQDLRRKTLESSALTGQPAGIADAGAAGAQDLAQAVAAQGGTLYKRLEAASDKLVLRRDPFSNSPLMAQARSPGDGASLSGIIWDKIKPVAVINGKIVKIGDSVDNSRIINIKQDRVVLNDGVKDYELKLGE